MIKTDGTGYRELVQDDAQGTMFNEGNPSIDWSWDTRHLLIMLAAKWWVAFDDR